MDNPGAYRTEPMLLPLSAALLVGAWLALLVILAAFAMDRARESLDRKRRTGVDPRASGQSVDEKRNPGGTTSEGEDP